MMSGGSSPQTKAKMAGENPGGDGLLNQFEQRSNTSAHRIVDAAQALNWLAVSYETLAKKGKIATLPLLLPRHCWR